MNDLTLAVAGVLATLIAIVGGFFVLLGSTVLMIRLMRGRAKSSLHPLSEQRSTWSETAQLTYRACPMCRARVFAADDGSRWCSKSTLEGGKCKYRKAGG